MVRRKVGCVVGNDMEFRLGIVFGRIVNVVSGRRIRGRPGGIRIKIEGHALCPV